MGTDRVRHKAEEYTGTAKRKTGEVTGDRDLQAEGTTQESKSKVKQVADDAVDKAREAFSRDDHDR